MTVVIDHRFGALRLGWWDRDDRRTADCWLIPGELTEPAAGGAARPPLVAWYFDGREVRRLPCRAPLAAGFREIGAQLRFMQPAKAQGVRFIAAVQNPEDPATELQTDEDPQLFGRRARGSDDWSRVLGCVEQFLQHFAAAPEPPPPADLNARLASRGQAAFRAMLAAPFSPATPAAPAIPAKRAMPAKPRGRKPSAPEAPAYVLSASLDFDLGRAALEWRRVGTQSFEAAADLDADVAAGLWSHRFYPPEGKPSFGGVPLVGVGLDLVLRMWFRRVPTAPAGSRITCSEIRTPERVLPAVDSEGELIEALARELAALLRHRREAVRQQEVERARLERERMRRESIRSAADREREAARAAAFKAEREKRLARRQQRDERARVGEARPSAPGPAPARPPRPTPEVALRVEWPPTAAPVDAAPGGSAESLRLRETAALWWISNQSDDLLCLPFCRIQKLDYQIRTALRVLGPLEGRALLSDEVGLGKTIEAGLVAKELFTRGMARRLLVLTLPSLVDQWREELAEKFDLRAATTNDPVFAADPAAFWRTVPIIVASLHTLKSPVHLAEAAGVVWDLVVVDEAHYLRKRESQAWQAVNALKRRFTLMLTATPVQNSLEELYNLVTLLKPGQLPSPKEFRARFIDPDQPRRPREPEALRRLLGEVMIRNTRANSGIDLPPRQAETILFNPSPAELAAWSAWESELRTVLASLPRPQASLWGRLLLRALGSSPAAWRSSLEKFPDGAASRRWRGTLEHSEAPSWQAKLRLLAPLTRLPGGVVVFTEFLQTQAAVAGALRAEGIPTFEINGGTPPPDRQPITERFAKEGGALILTHSGTEGRNLQFCRCLANFDLPWNPMEIEQRIGRLHRLGQQHPVRICNFVQAGTLQEHLLGVLQEKLNLFELVVGETGLVLGDRYSGDEFAEEVFTRWREHEGRVAEAISALGEELAAARAAYAEVKQLDETLFAKDYETL